MLAAIKDEEDFDFDNDLNPNLNLKHELKDSIVDRRGSSNVPALAQRNEREQKQHEKDKFQRHLQRGASGFLREMMQNRFQRQATQVHGEKELTKEMVADALGGIGKHPLSGKHAFLELNLKGLKLFDCAALKDFPNIVYADISKNAIQDISPLSSVLAMTHLDASKNEIPTLRNFAPPLCSKENSWADGKQSVGSMLIYANLANNKISDLEGISDHPFLECLLLGHNAISSMEGLMPLRNLQVLDLSYNSLASILPLAGLQIQELNLEGNEIKDLTGLEVLPRLRSLNVCDNLVTDLEPLSLCAELSYLDVSGNKITQMETFFVLKSCVNLRKLLGLRNRASDKLTYRRQLIYQLPTLETLDVTFVSAVEQLEAYNHYRDPLGDYALMQEVFTKYFPGETLPDPDAGGAEVQSMPPMDTMTPRMMNPITEE
jgi:hypothetical protein